MIKRSEDSIWSSPLGIVLIKSSFILGFSIFSTILFFGLAAIFTPYVIPIDIFINNLCAVLMFKFSENLFSIFCWPCLKVVKRWKTPINMVEKEMGLQIDSAVSSSMGRSREGDF